MSKVPIIGEKVVLRPYKLEAPNPHGVSKTVVPVGAGFVRIGYWRGDLSVWLLHKTGLPTAENTFIIFDAATMEEFPKVEGGVSLIGEVTVPGKDKAGYWPTTVKMVFAVQPPRPRMAQPPIIPLGGPPIPIREPGA